MATWDDLELNSPVAIYDKGANAKPEYNNFGEFLHINMWDGDVRLPKVQMEEPLKTQDRYFLEAIRNGAAKKSDGRFALGIVRVLEAVSDSIRGNGTPVRVKE